MRLILIPTLVFFVVACGNSKNIDPMKWEQDQHPAVKECPYDPTAPYSILTFSTGGTGIQKWQLLKNGKIVFDECTGTAGIVENCIYSMKRLGSLSGSIQGNYIDSHLPIQETLELRGRLDCASQSVLIGIGTVDLHFKTRYVMGMDRCRTTDTRADATIEFK